MFVPIQRVGLAGVKAGCKMVKVQLSSGKYLQPQLENGRYVIKFTPTSQNEVIRISNGSQTPDLIGDDVFRQLMLVHGETAKPYVPNESAESQLKKIFNNLKQIELDLTDPQGLLKTSLHLSRQGILAEFVDSSNNLRTDITSIAGKILAQTRSEISTSIRTQSLHSSPY